MGMLVVVSLRLSGVGSSYAYVIPGAIVWAVLLMTGAHPTLAGVVLGLMTPVMSRRLHEQPPVVRVQAALHPWVAYIVMPLFALANAGVSLDGVDLSAGGSHWVMTGVAIALIAGKPKIGRARV